MQHGTPQNQTPQKPLVGVKAPAGNCLGAAAFQPRAALTEPETKTCQRSSTDEPAAGVATCGSSPVAPGSPVQSRALAPVLTYLAAPYSHLDPLVREQRFNLINKHAAELMRNGVLLFSPISHTHPIAICGGLPAGFDYWERYDRAILSCCSNLLVLMLDGWCESKGVKAEIEIARELGIDIKYLAPEPKE